MWIQTKYIATVLFSSLWFSIVDGSDETQYIRRVDQQEIDCVPLLKVTQFDHESYHPGPHAEWNCQLLSSTPAAMGKSGKIIKLNHLYNLPEGTIQKFESGSSVLSISGAQVTAAGIEIPKGAGATVLKTKIDTRRLQTSGVKKKVLVIRVKTQAGTTTASADTISDKIFGTSGDPVNLSSQYDDCSYGKLTFSSLNRLNFGDPALDAPGVYEVEVATSTRNHEQLRELITDKLNDDWPNTPLPDVSWGDLNGASRFDHIMYCMPPDTDMGIAYAFVNSWLSVYKDNWCLYPSAQIHEIGHNIGLDHSWEGDREYADQSGMMGFSYASDDHPKMCFNAAKSWQLGFYADKATTVNPLINPNWSGRLVGIANYNDAGNDQVLVKIETGRSVDYYLNFNRKTGINSETQEGGNQVLITTQGAEGAAFAKSTMVAKLSEGQAFEISGFGGVSNRLVQITVNKIDTRASPGYADITIRGSSQPGPTPSPTPRPTLRPTMPPVSPPTPTPSPVRVTDLVLVDAATNQDIAGAFECSPYVCLNGATSFNIRADTTSAVKSVRFAISGPITQDPRVENVKPFSALGDVGGDYNKQAFPPGRYKVIAEPFDDHNASGTAGPITTLEFEVADGPGPTPPPTLRPTLPPTPRPTLRPTMPPVSAPTPTSSPVRVTDLVLVDAATNKDIDGAFDCSPYACLNGATSFNIRADTTSAVKSVRFAISGPVTQEPRVENVRPFSALGDDKGNYNGRAFPPGRYKVIAEPFDDHNASGTAGPITTLEFEVDSNGSTGGSWEDITSDDFEQGWGSFERVWKQGGKPDADRITALQQQAYIHQGSAALRIRDGSDSETNSSVFHVDNHDVRGFSDLRVLFWFYPRSMPSKDEFLLEYSSDGGSSWNTVKTFQNGRDFVNGQFYNEAIVFGESELTATDFKLTSQAKIRFRCAASSNTDLVYIDEVLFQGYKK